MDFDIRAISLAASVDFDARIAVPDVLGKEIEFRSGISQSITLPDSLEAFQSLSEAGRLLNALNYWTRFYSYPNGDHKLIHVLATAEGVDPAAEILLYRLDLKQPIRMKPGPRSAVEILGGAVMTYEECGQWLVELSFRLATNQDHAKGSLRLVRPPRVKSKLLRVGWVGPEKVASVRMDLRLNAIGQVFGAEIVHVAPRAFAHVANRLSQLSPLDAVVICSRFAPYIGIAAVPKSVRRELIHLCESEDRRDLEKEIAGWIETVGPEIEKEQENQSGDANAELLRIMLQGMLSHSKIGPFNHCQKQTVLTRVKARHLNVAVAERILEENSEAFYDKKDSAALFLWKDHHDGDQYFLNPQLIEKVKVMVGAAINSSAAKTGV